MNIYLLRHGETDWNRAERLQGHTDILLNEKGRMQMEHAGKVLHDLDIKMDLILSSPLSRARESARIVADELGYKRENVLVEQGLIERCFGLGEGLTAEERKEKYPDGILPEMESFEEAVGRARLTLGRIVDSYRGMESILLVSHGAILHALLASIADGRFAYIGKSLILDQGNVYLIRNEENTVEIARYSPESTRFENVDTYQENGL